jgi:hypothetical protein
MIYIVVLVAVVVVPAKLGGYGAVFDAANDAFKAKGGATGLLLKPSQMLPYATLALGSALAAFMYPHTLTGIFASKSADTIRKNAILLPAYTLLLGPDRAARLHGLCRPHQGRSQQRRRAALFKACSRTGLPALRYAAIAIGALVPAAVMSIGAANLFTRNVWKSYVNPDISHAGEAQVAKITSLVVKVGALRLHPVPADAIRARSAIARRLVDPADLSGAGVRAVHYPVVGEKASVSPFERGERDFREFRGSIARVSTAADGRAAHRGDHVVHGGDVLSTDRECGRIHRMRVHDRADLRTRFHDVTVEAPLRRGLQPMLARPIELHWDNIFGCHTLVG